MVSLYDSFAMFPSGPHHPHHPHHPGVAGSGAGAGHPMLTRHPSHPGGLHHQHHHVQAAQHQSAYFGYSHPHYSGGNAAGSVQYTPNMMAANELHHQQQFSSAGLVDTGASWHAPAVYSGISGVSGVSPARTPVTSGVSYEDWVNSPNQQQNQNQGGGVSSPDASPSIHPQFHPSEFITPHPQDVVSITRMNASSGNAIHSGSAMNGSTSGTSAVGVTGHHSPDSGLAGSDGLSSAGSPTQQQQSMLASSMMHPHQHPHNPHQQQQQQQQQQQHQQQQQTSHPHLLVQQAAAAAAAGVNSGTAAMTSIPAGMVGISRPQPSRSPFEWMKKPSYHNQVNPGKSSIRISHPPTHPFIRTIKYQLLIKKKKS